MAWSDIDNLEERELNALGHIDDHKKIVKALKTIKNNNFIKNEITIASMGDSLTEENHDVGGFYIASRRAWADLGVLLSNSKVSYLGSAATGGYTIQQVKDTHLPTILNLKPMYCTVLCGQNSLIGFNDATETLLKSIYFSLMDAGIVPILMSNPPTTNDPAKFRLNVFNARFAQAYNLPFFDMAKPLTDTATGLYKSGLSDDTIHPNGAGTAVIAKAFAVFINETFPVKGPESMLPQSPADGTQYNSQMAANASDATLANLWFKTTDGNSVIENNTFGTGKKFRIIKKAGNRIQANGPIQTLIPGQEYEFVCRFEAAVESFTGSWTLQLLSVGSNYQSIFNFENITCDVPAGTLVAFRFKMPTTYAVPADAGKVIPVIQVLGNSAYQEDGSAGANIAIAQMNIIKLSSIER